MKTKKELEKSIKEALEKSKVYNTTTDGSYNASLHYYNYYNLVKELNLARKKMLKNNKMEIEGNY
tara:strand:+ start:1616 stop:1810 length:195 start_codon:yes stop_codon:yes gene_type:complete